MVARARVEWVGCVHPRARVCVRACVCVCGHTEFDVAEGVRLDEGPLQAVQFDALLKERVRGLQDERRVAMLCVV